MATDNPTAHTDILSPRSALFLEKETDTPDKMTNEQKYENTAQEVHLPHSVPVSFLLLSQTVQLLPFVLLLPTSALKYRLFFCIRAR